MHLDNKTTWNTSELRRFFKLICQYECYSPETVEVVYARDSYSLFNTSAAAKVGSGWIRMRLPNRQIIYKNEDGIKKEIKELKGFRLKDIAQTFAHELGHNRGLVHRDMIEQTGINVDYTEDIAIIRARN